MNSIRVEKYTLRVVLNKTKTICNLIVIVICKMVLLKRVSSHYSRLSLSIGISGNLVEEAKTRGEPYAEQYRWRINRRWTIHFLVFLFVVSRYIEIETRHVSFEYESERTTWFLFSLACPLFVFIETSLWSLRVSKNTWLRDG